MSVIGGRSAKFELILTTRCQLLGVDLPNLNSSWPLDVSTKQGRSAGRSSGRSAKFELILTTRCQYWGDEDLVADLGVDLPNLNSSWPLDVGAREGRSGGRSRGRSAKFELILTTRCKYQGEWDLLPDLGHRSAKFELILTTRCQYGEIDLVADLGVDLLNIELILTPTWQSWGLDLPNLNSSWPLDVSTKDGRSSARSRGRSGKFELILTTRCQY